MTHPSGAKLALPRNGSATLVLKNGAPDSNLENLFAAWQTPEPGVPRRVVVRIDGIIQDIRASEPEEPPLSVPAGIPCGMVLVRYTVGGFQREVLVDAVNQSALVVWAETVDVQGVWDTKRIARIFSGASATAFFPCQRQQVAAVISVAQVSDQGAGDARYLDVLAPDFTQEGEVANEFVVLDVPPGARGFRFLDAIASGVVVSVPSAAAIIEFSFNSAREAIALLNASGTPMGVEYVTNGATDTSIIAVPVGARSLIVSFTAGTIATFDQPAYIEWLLAPNTLPVLS